MSNKMWKMQITEWRPQIASFVNSWKPQSLIIHHHNNKEKQQKLTFK